MAKRKIKKGEACAASPERGNVFAIPARKIVAPNPSNQEAISLYLVAKFRDELRDDQLSKSERKRILRAFWHNMGALRKLREPAEIVRITKAR